MNNYCRNTAVCNLFSCRSGYRQQHNFSFFFVYCILYVLRCTVCGTEFCCCCYLIFGISVLSLVLNLSNKPLRSYNMHVAVQRQIMI